MKTIAILLCTLYFASYVVVRADNDDDLILSCLKQVGLTIDDVSRLLYDKSEQGIRKRGCVEACAMKNLGMMNGNTINIKQLDENIDEILANNEDKESVRQSIHQCASSAANEDECLVARSFANCGMQQLKLHFNQLIDKMKVLTPDSTT